MELSKLYLKKEKWVKWNEERKKDEDSHITTTKRKVEKIRFHGRKYPKWKVRETQRVEKATVQKCLKIGGRRKTKSLQAREKKGS